MSRKIAIITTREYYSGYDGEDYNKIVESITDWEEVSDEDFKTLQFAAGRMNFQILEQPTDMKKFVAKTIADYKAVALAEAAAMAEEKRKREEAALARKFKKELKDRESKLKMLKKLQEELGADAT
jgi:hypothetical protein